MMKAIREGNSADAMREINLTGRCMGQLRTANNRRNRATRIAEVRKRAAATETLTGETIVAVRIKATPE